MSNQTPKWRKVLISGSNAHVHAITASNIDAAVSDPTIQKVLVYDTTSGAFYYTGSYGSGGTGGGGNPASPNQSVQFNNNGSFGGNSGFLFDSTQDASLFVSGAITGSVLIAQDTDGVPAANIVVRDADGNNICQLARVGSGANAHLGRLVLRDNSNIMVQLAAGTSDSYITNTGQNAKLGINITSPGKELTVNGAISSSAEISASNAAFDTFGAQNELVLVGPAGSITSSDAISIDSAGNVGIGTSSPAVRLHIVGEGGGTSQIRMDQYNDTTDAPDLRAKRARGTISAPANIIAGDYLFRFNVEGRFSNNFTTYGSMQFDADSADPTAMVWNLQTRDTSANLEDRITVDSSGNTNFTGNISSSGELSAATVTGFISSDGDNRILTSDGDGTLTAENTLTYNGTIFALQTQNIDMQASEGGFDLTGNITASGNISASGDLSINGIPDVSASIADAAGSGGGGVVTSYTNGANNRVITSTGTSGINGESGLIFNGSVLDVGVNSSNRITLSGGNGTLGTTSNLTIGNNSTNTNVNALLQFAAKSGGYYAGSFVNTDDTTSTFSTNGRHVGEFIDVPSAASVTAGKIVYYRSTTTSWQSAQANAVATATPLLGMTVDTATTTRAMVRGYIRVAASDIGGPTPTLGELLYLSTGSAGTFQTLAPTTAGHIARSVGYTIQSVGGRGGVSAYVVYFNPSNDYVKL